MRSLCLSTFHSAPGHMTLGTVHLLFHRAFATLLIIRQHTPSHKPSFQRILGALLSFFIFHSFKCTIIVLVLTVSPVSFFVFLTVSPVSVVVSYPLHRSYLWHRCSCSYRVSGIVLCLHCRVSGIDCCCSYRVSGVSGCVASFASVVVS